MQSFCELRGRRKQEIRGAMQIAVPGKGFAPRLMQLIGNDDVDPVPYQMLRGHGDNLWFRSWHGEAVHDGAYPHVTKIGVISHWRAHHHRPAYHRPSVQDSDAPKTLVTIGIECIQNGRVAYSNHGVMVFGLHP